MATWRCSAATASPEVCRKYGPSASTSAVGGLGRGVTPRSQPIPLMSSEIVPFPASTPPTLGEPSIPYFSHHHSRFPLPFPLRMSYNTAPKISTNAIGVNSTSVLTYPPPPPFVPEHLLNIYQRRLPSFCSVFGIHQLSTIPFLNLGPLS